MIAVDTNILVYAHRDDSPFHSVADRCIAELAEGSAPWAIPWPCVHEFIAIVTNPRIYRPPTPLETACNQIDAWTESPSLVMLGESDGYWQQLRSVILSSQVVGPRVHDARIVALCRHNDVHELWSADRDFGRFRDISVVNPLVR
ncbi:MAG: type II toxin-antitoxin system VapC family toxin [Xanthobacteraceae bacterium]